MNALQSSAERLQDATACLKEIKSCGVTCQSTFSTRRNTVFLTVQLSVLKNPAPQSYKCSHSCAANPPLLVLSLKRAASVSGVRNVELEQAAVAPAVRASRPLPQVPSLILPLTACGEGCFDPTVNIIIPVLGRPVWRHIASSCCRDMDRSLTVVPWSSQPPHTGGS